mmetsp:Transcript_95728/g.247503  ORF Transcript_95728/g.247503 Transcript_95728/m.247503 type:complete len:84 (-) Transcript_95728:554-805(-)
MPEEMRVTTDSAVGQVRDAILDAMQRAANLAGGGSSDRSIAAPPMPRGSANRVACLSTSVEGQHTKTSKEPILGRETVEDAVP